MHETDPSSGILQLEPSEPIQTTDDVVLKDPGIPPEPPARDLEVIRKKIVANRFIIKSHVAKRYTNFTNSVEEEAGILVDRQLTQLSERGSITKDIPNLERNKDNYRKRFLIIVRQLSLASILMCEDHENPLLDSDDRRKILRQLSREYRRIAFELASGQSEKIVPTVWDASKPQIHSPEQIRHFIRDRPEQISMSSLRKFIKDKPFSPLESMQSSQALYKKLSEDPRFTILQPSIIKKGAERIDEASAEAYLEGVVEDFIFYSNHKLYRIFGRNLILDIVANSRLDVQARFKWMYELYHELKADPEYSVFAPTQLRSVVARYGSRERASEELNKAKRQFKLFRQNPDFDFIPNSTLTSLVIDSSDPKKLNQKIKLLKQVFEELTNSTSYSILGKKTIIRLLSKQRDYKGTLKLALKNIDSLKNDQRFIECGFDVSKIIRSPWIIAKNFDEKIPQLLNTYRQIRKMPDFAEYEDYLLQDVVIDRDPKKVIRFMKRAKANYIRLSNEHPYNTFTKGLLLTATIKQPSEPEKFLLNFAKRNIDRYASSNGIHLTPVLISCILATYPRQPSRAIRELQQFSDVEKVENDPLSEDFHNKAKKYWGDSDMYRAMIELARQSRVRINQNEHYLSLGRLVTVALLLNPAKPELILSRYLRKIETFAVREELGKYTIEQIREAVIAKPNARVSEIPSIIASNKKRKFPSN